MKTALKIGRLECSEYSFNDRDFLMMMNNLEKEDSEE